MNFKKAISLILASASMCAFSTLSQADDITLENQSIHNLYLNINHDTSSAAFLLAGATVVFDEEDLKKSCQTKLTSCEMNIYQSSTAKEISAVTFEATAITSVSNSLESDVFVSAQGSHIFIKNK